MSSDDIRIILRKFYMPLRNKIQPQEIAPVIDGLTDFDRQQIAATAKNEGALLGNDKLLDTLGRRTTRSFVSFVTLLRDSNPDLAEDILKYTFTYFQHIHNSFQNYQKEQSRPSAAVKPSVTTQSLTDTYSHSHSAVSHRLGAVPQAQVTYNREQESTYTTTTFTVRQSVHRTTDLRTVRFSEDTLLEDVPNITFVRWATELNHGDSWNKLGDILQLSRKQIKELKNKQNPGEDILDLLSSKEDVTVKGLVDLLESVQLLRLVDIIKESIEPAIHDEFTDGRETQTNRTQDISPTHDQQSCRNQQSQQDSSPPVEEVRQFNLNDSTGSTTNNEDVVETTGAEGVNKTLINNLNRSEYKFEMVKEVHIYLPADGDKTQVVKESNTESTSTERNVCTETETSTVETEISSEENMTPSPSVNAQMDQIVSPLMGNEHKTQSPILEQRDVATSISLLEEDQILPSAPDGLAGGQLIAQPSMTGREIFGKNVEQERADLSIELRHQPNLDSFRDLRNSIPDSEQSVDNTTLKQCGNQRGHYSNLTHQPESTLGSHTHHEKNAEQEYEALHRDVINQQTCNTTGDLQ